MLVGLGTGALIGYLVGTKEYEYVEFDLAMADKKKYEEINAVIRKGLDYNTKKKSKK